MKIKSWRVHNYIAHPASQMFSDVGRGLEKLLPENSTLNTIFHSFTGKTIQQYFDSLGERIHNGTLPSKD